MNDNKDHRVPFFFDPPLFFFCPIIQHRRRLPARRTHKMHSPASKRRKMCYTEPRLSCLSADLLHYVASQHLTPRARTSFLCTSKAILQTAAIRVHLNPPRERPLCEADACEHLVVPGWAYPRARHATVTLSDTDPIPHIDPDKFPLLRTIRLVISRGVDAPRDLQYGRYTFGWKDKETAPVITEISGTPASIARLVLLNGPDNWTQVDRIQIDASNAGTPLSATESRTGLLNPAEISIYNIPGCGHTTRWSIIPFLGTRTERVSFQPGQRLSHFIFSLGKRGALDTVARITLPIKGLELVSASSCDYQKARDDIFPKIALTRDTIANRGLRAETFHPPRRGLLECFSMQILREWYAMRLVYDDDDAASTTEFVLECILKADHTPESIVGLYYLHLQGPLRPLSVQDFSYRTAGFVPVRYEDRIIGAFPASDHCI